MAERGVLALLLCLVATPAWSGPAPSLELLEFLADWQDENGNWVDPFELPESRDGAETPKEGENDEN